MRVMVVIFFFKRLGCICKYRNGAGNDKCRNGAGNGARALFANAGVEPEMQLGLYLAAVANGGVEPEM